MSGVIQSPLCGILNLDKPLGTSSHEMVVAVRKLTGQRKVGHAGTLDPLATGVLLLCLGKATRVSQFLMDSHKVYRTTVHLGVSTTTHDREGKITSRCNVEVGRKDIEAAVTQFVGRIDQVPPAYSAIKVRGKRLYSLARQGIAVQVPPRQVDVYRLDVIEWAPPFLTLEVECGAGTYIRALARDLGQAIGCGAHLTALRRTQSGQFTVEQAVTLPELERASATGDITGYLHPLDAAFAHLPALHLEPETAYRLALGQAIPDDTGKEGIDLALGQTQARAYAPGGRFVALVFRDQTVAGWRPRKVFVDPQDLVTPKDV